jgi:amidase
MKGRTLTLVACVWLALTFQPAIDAQNGGGHQGTSRLDLVEATVPQLQQALQTRLITSEQLVQMYLARIAAYDDAGPKLNAYLTVNPNALAEARALDAARHPGKARSPLYGIPVLLKDNVDTADMPTTAGSVALEGSIPPDDAFITKKLRDAGAIILGKATLTEFANFLTNGMPAGYSSLGGYGFNPYDPRPAPGGDGRPVLSPGGSSSGSGIAVAANLTAVAVGTETSGSILSPASSNMNVGIKPTVGLISRDGIIPITADQDTAGPITRTVTDAAILLGVLAGHDPSDPATNACLTPGNCFSDYTRFLDKKALKGARIAVVFNNNRAAIMNAAIDVMRAQGAYVEIISGLAPQLPGCPSNVFPPVEPWPPPGCASALFYGFKRDLNAYLASLGAGAPIQTLSEVIAFNEAHADVALKYGQILALLSDTIDITPGSADTAQYTDSRAQDIIRSRGALDAVYNGADGVRGTPDDFDSILFSANSGAGTPAKAGYPSITVPGGLVPPTPPIDNPFPSGVTFSGRAFSEPLLIGLAYAFEQATLHRVPPASTPPLPSDVVRRP